MKALRSLAVAALLAGTAASTAFADSPVSMKFTSGGSVTAFGYFVGTYHGEANGAPVDLFCVDFLHHVSIGQTWMANFTGLTSGSLSNTRLNDLLRYQKAAWLTAQFGLQPTSQWGDIQATIWDIMNPGAGPAPSSTSWLNAVNVAATTFGTYDFSSFSIVTDVNKDDPNSVQEFITTTPEPAEVVLLGTGLFGIVLTSGFVRRRSA